MVFKIKTSGLHTKSVNGKQVINKQFDVGLDSTKEENQQVKATIVNDDKKYGTTDSLQNFIDNLNKNENSIFQLLSKEKYNLNQVKDKIKLKNKTKSDEKKPKRTLRKKITEFFDNKRRKISLKRKKRKNTRRKSESK
jgi:hypothetical protein